MITNYREIIWHILIWHFLNILVYKLLHEYWNNFCELIICYKLKVQKITNISYTRKRRTAEISESSVNYNFEAYKIILKNINLLVWTRRTIAIGIVDFEKKDKSFKYVCFKLKVQKLLKKIM